MAEPIDWIQQLGAAVTVTDAAGTILALNERAQQTFAGDGGGALVSHSVFDCHPPRARALLDQLYAGQRPNHYTIRKAGQRKIIHQLPWYKGGVFAGLVEISVPIPDQLPHFDRG